MLDWDKKQLILLLHVVNAEIKMGFIYPNLSPVHYKTKQKTTVVLIVSLKKFFRDVGILLQVLLDLTTVSTILESYVKTWWKISEDWS